VKSEKENFVAVGEVDYSSADILSMLKDLPDACCIFKVLTDPFGTVTDMQFLFANEKYAKLVGTSSAELIGARYFDTVSNRDEDWIKLSYQAGFMRQSVIKRTFNTQYDKWFEFWAVPVYKKGFCAFIIHDVTAVKRDEEDKAIKSNSNKIILECAKVLTANEFKKGIRSTLKILGTALDADRIYIIECKHGEPGEIYDWIDKKNGRGLPARKYFEDYDFFTMWNKQLQDKDVIVVNDSGIVAGKNKDVYDNVLSGVISKYIITRIMDKSDVIGYLVADNYSEEVDLNIAEVFETVAIFISEELRNYNLMRSVSYMSVHDGLTDLGNRNMFNANMNMFKDMSTTVGVCFADINGLKFVNDTEGHEAGDNLIKEAASVFSSIFKRKYCYRIGGDEFIAIVPQVEKDYFEGQVEKLRKKSKKVPMAVGAIWEENADNIEYLVNEADKLMYADKSAYYSAEEKNRRH